uniref:protein kinase domain-containing protein n=1 Tax=Flavobacterium sp. TaxID=239 RepID=UPI00404ACE91
MKDHNVPIIIRQFIRNQKIVAVDRYSDVGGMSALYFGEREIIRDRVAMKFYQIDAFGIAHNEPYLLKSLENKNILKIYHAEVLTNQFAYYLTPEMSGGDLQNYLEKNIIKTHEALDIINGVLSGLSELHNYRLVHRDLKTHNVLIDAHTLNPVIADFGFVRYITPTDKSTSASSYTHLYRSKEMITENEHTFQSDLYQVGIIFYQILGGYFPFEFNGWISSNVKLKYNSFSTEIEKYDFWKNLIDQKIIKNKLLNIDSLPIYVSPKLKKIIRTATNPDLNKRYKSCSEFLLAIHNYRNNCKNWWIDNTDIFALNKKGNKKYKIENFKSTPKLSISINGSKPRSKIFLSLEEIINFIEND